MMKTGRFILTVSQRSDSLMTSPAHKEVAQPDIPNLYPKQNSLNQAKIKRKLLL